MVVIFWVVLFAFILVLFSVCISLWQQPNNQAYFPYTNVTIFKKQGLLKTYILEEQKMWMVNTRF